MAHFAKLDDEGSVVFVTVGRDEDNESELSERTGDVYKQTSYNTRAGIHYGSDGKPSADQSKAFRKNYAAVGFKYDPVRDAFIPPQPFLSWILDEQTCLWKSPVPRPEDLGKNYTWDETTQNWVED